MAEQENLCGRTLGGPDGYLIRERLGQGSSLGGLLVRERLGQRFSDVYRGEQLRLGREVVVKVLHRRLRGDDVALQRFSREVQLAGWIDHPYAAYVYQVGVEPDGLLWFAMESVVGIALNHRLKERGPILLDKFVSFFERVAEVVQIAHERGFVHRDLKPSNVMMIESPPTRMLPKLLDFGISDRLVQLSLGEPWAVSSPPTWVSLGRDGNGSAASTDSLAITFGSPPYMSPEQWNNAVTVGPASDLYALGVIAYEALTGRRPFTATSIAEYRDLHSNYPVPPLGDGFSPDLDRVFQRALAKRPEERWATALEFAAAVRAAAQMKGRPR